MGFRRGELNCRESGDDKLPTASYYCIRKSA